jgi:hypothetical protein
MPDNVLPWKVMVDFWAEKIFYFAPSDYVKECMERLAKGFSHTSGSSLLMLASSRLIGIYKRTMPTPPGDRVGRYIRGT